MCWFQLDGEQVQIECYSHPATVDILRDSNIVVGKLPASTTAVTQPCDAGNCFKSAKCTLKVINDADISKHRPFVTEGLV
jgi:hypothetical protein